ncbi:hypothetical protein KBA84_00535 [Patescibacteria group bacterium]|nr:hypothetical protein [Patescibacteria group bacterium]
METIRREGRELQVGPPQVIFKEEEGKKLEPIEQLIVNVDDGLSGTIIEKMAGRKGMMQAMNSENGLTTLEFEIPTRGLLGFRSEFILLTKGEGIMYSSFSHYDNYRGDIEKRSV